MHLSLISVLAFLAAPLGVLACEGECIEDITAKYISLISGPVKSAMINWGQSLISELDLNSAPDSPELSPYSLIKPALHLYRNISYANMRTDIFPSYFHGKCQDPTTGTDPDGCPKPDCPVVCGTPGSLVHFYSTLRNIVFNSTTNSMATSMDPKSSPFSAIREQVVERLEKKAMVTAQYHRKERSSIRKNVTATLKRGTKHFRMLLQESCGGQGRPDCDWKAEMVPFINSFP